MQIHVQFATPANAAHKQRLDVDRNAPVAEVRRMALEAYRSHLPQSDADRIQSIRLLFKGKQLEDGLSIFHYDVKPHETLQLFPRFTADVTDVPRATSENKPPVTAVKSECDYPPAQRRSAHTLKPKIRIEALDESLNAWFEAIVKSVAFEPVFGVQLRWVEYNETATIRSLDHLKPVATRVISAESSLSPGEKLLVNYNFDDPGSVGFWYRATLIQQSPEGVLVDLIGADKQSIKPKIPYELNESTMVFYDECFTFDNLTDDTTASDFQQQPSVSNSLTVSEEQTLDEAADEFDCDLCKKNPLRKKCYTCGCGKCHLRGDDVNTVVCDDCRNWFHWRCVGLEDLPNDDWYCENCFNKNDIVNPGEKIDLDKKSKMPSANTNKKWGKGFACMGQSKKCTIVNPHHVGPIPGIAVGTNWLYRIQAAEAGVHRAPVSGICGSKQSKGALSICMSKGYDEDEDHGDEVYYTGSGGRDLSGNKRQAPQSFDQELTLSNLALAMTCDAKLNSVEGAEAKDWRKSRAIRVMRTDKMRTRSEEHGKYAPKQGCRYDGIYKLVKYWPEVSKASGFKVWRFLFRRDDPAPAPWTPEWEEWAKQPEQLVYGLGQLILPEGYDPDALLDKKKGKRKSNEGDASPAAGGKKKKTMKSDDVEDKENTEQDSNAGSSSSVSTVRGFVIPSFILDLVKHDTLNGPHWETLKERIDQQNKQSSSAAPKIVTFADFTECVSEHFQCPICFELPGGSARLTDHGDTKEDWNTQPVTLSCGGGHTACRRCLVELVLSTDTGYVLSKLADRDERAMDEDDYDDDEEPKVRAGNKKVDEDDVEKLTRTHMRDLKKAEKRLLSVSCPVCRHTCPELVEILEWAMALAYNCNTGAIKSGGKDKVMRKIAANTILPANHEFMTVLSRLNLRTHDLSVDN